MNEDFDRSFTMPILGIATFGFGAAAGLDGGWPIWMGALGVGLAILELALGRARPIVSITPRSLILRPVVIRSAREILFVEIAAWGASRRFLRLRLLDGSKADLYTQSVRSDQRERLLARLAELDLGVSDFADEADEDVQSLERRMKRLIVFTVTASIVAALCLTFWYMP